jgi:hypothetical protein
MEPEDGDAVLERSVPADLGTTHMEASVATGRYSRGCAGCRVKATRTLWPSSPACF